MPLDKWTPNKRVGGTSYEVKQLNRYLDQIYNKAHQVFEKFIVQDKPITAELIRNAVFNMTVEEEGTSLMYLSKYHFENSGNKLRWGTLKHYKVTERYFLRFLKAKHKLTDIPLKNIDFKFLIDFENFLRNWKPTDPHKPLNNNGVIWCSAFLLSIPLASIGYRLFFEFIFKAIKSET